MRVRDLINVTKLSTCETTAHIITLRLQHCLEFTYNSVIKKTPTQATSHRAQKCTKMIIRQNKRKHTHKRENINTTQKRKQSHRDTKQQQRLELHN